MNFGGEQSGHIIFSDFAKTGDALVAAMQVMAYLLTSKKKASVLLNPFELYPQLLKNIAVGKKVPLENIEGLASLEAALAEENIRSLVRYSGTENVLRILLEGEDGARLHARMETLEAFFTKALNG